ncbi:hypothetical protein ACWKWU_04920 [Chitinophaga lutea]
MQLSAAYVTRVWGNTLALSPLLSIFLMLVFNFTNLTYCWLLFLIMFCWSVVVSIPAFVLFSLSYQYISRHVPAVRERKYWSLAAGNLLWLATYVSVILISDLQYADRLVGISLGTHLLCFSLSALYCRMEETERQTS